MPVARVRHFGMMGGGGGGFVSFWMQEARSKKKNANMRLVRFQRAAGPCVCAHSVSHVPG